MKWNAQESCERVTCSYSKSRRRSFAHRTTTLPSRANQSRGGDVVDRGQLAVPSTVGRSGRRARSCLDCREPGTTLSRSAPDLFTISTSVTAGRQHSGANADAVFEDGSRHCFGHAPCELCVDCGDRIIAFGQLRPLMDTPV